MVTVISIIPNNNEIVKIRMEGASNIPQVGDNISWVSFVNNKHVAHNGTVVVRKYQYNQIYEPRDDEFRCEPVNVDLWVDEYNSSR
jgi:hypothetical protein